MFSLLTVTRKPTVYLVLDGGQTATSLSVTRRLLLSLLNEANVGFEIDTYVGVATYNGSDTGVGRYLTELCQPFKVEANRAGIKEALQNIVEIANRSDTGAAIRDAASKLSRYKNTGGSVLFLATSSMIKSSTFELDVIELLLENNILLIVLERHRTEENVPVAKSLERVTRLTDGIYRYAPSDLDWLQINSYAVNQLVSLSRSPLQFNRRTVS